MAQDPEEVSRHDEFDSSHDLDLIPFYFSQTIDAASEAEILRSILQAAGIPAVMTNEAPGFPNLGYLLMVPRDRVDQAREAIAEQRAAGPGAAAEAEAQTE